MQDTETNPHPRPNIASKYKVWPLLDFQSAVEDHLQGVTHIIQKGLDGLDSKTNLTLRSFRLDVSRNDLLGSRKVHEWGGFSTSKMRASIENGGIQRLERSTSANNPRSQVSRYSSRSPRNFWIELGVTQKDISVPLATLFAHNTKKIDDDAPRLSFIRNPVEISLTGNIPENVELPVHPNHEDKGVRLVNLNPPSIFIESDDAKNRPGSRSLQTLMQTAISNQSNVLTSGQSFTGLRFQHRRTQP